MKLDKTKPYVIYLAEIIYKDVTKIKTNNSEISNIEAIEGFIGTKRYIEISSGSFHDSWFKNLENNKFIDNETGKKIPDRKLYPIAALVIFIFVFLGVTAFYLDITQPIKL